MNFHPALSVFCLTPQAAISVGTRCLLKILHPTPSFRFFCMNVKNAKLQTSISPGPPLPDVSPAKSRVNPPKQPLAPI